MPIQTIKSRTLRAFGVTLRQLKAEREYIDRMIDYTMHGIQLAEQGPRLNGAGGPAGTRKPKGESLQARVAKLFAMNNKPMDLAALRVALVESGIMNEEEANSAGVAGAIYHLAGRKKVKRIKPGVYQQVKG
jgi:hypothetical protein